MCYDDDTEECLNRIYNSIENREKFLMLGEYYKVSYLHVYCLVPQRYPKIVHATRDHIFELVP